MASIEYSQVRKGMVIVGDDGQLYHVVDRDLNTPGNWRAILQLKLKNLKTGSITMNRVRPQDKVEQAYLDKREMQYLYKEGEDYVFMDNETFDQITLSGEMVGDQMPYMKENNNAQVTFYEGKALSLELPATVELKVRLAALLVPMPVVTPCRAKVAASVRVTAPAMVTVELTGESFGLVAMSMAASATLMLTDSL